MKTIQKALVIAAIAASAMGSNLILATTASAGEGHWSIGKGVQCRIVQGAVVCSGARP